MDRIAAVGASVVIKGELSASEDVVIAGRVEGSVTVEGHLVVVEPGGQVAADVVAKGDVVTLIVTEVNLPADVQLETFAKAIQSQVKQIVESDVPLKPVLLSSGRGYSMAYTAQLTRPDGQQASVAVTQILYLVPGRGYVMTFAAPQSRAQDYAQDISDVATSFRIKL